jgi:hypothetical protein
MVALKGWCNVKHAKLITGLSVALMMSLFAGVSMVMANTGYFKEPKRPVGLSEDIRWDSSAGEYVLGEGLGGLGSNGLDVVGTAEATVNPQWAWYVGHKDSADAIDKAIVEWVDTVDHRLGLLSWYDPDSDVAFQKTIMSLGIQRLPEILKRAKTDEVWNGLMMAAFAEIAQLKELEQISVTAEGKAKWFGILKEKAVAGRALNSGDSVAVQATDLGVLALPYLAAQAKTDVNALDKLRTLSGEDLAGAADVSEETASVEALIEIIINEY